MPRLRATRGHRRARGAFLALALAAGLLTSCGDDSSSSGLSENRAAALRSTLDEVEVQVAQSDCTAATRQALAFRQEVDSLPSSVDQSLRDALSGSAARLESLVESQCTTGTAAPSDQQTTETTPSDQSQGNQGKKDKKPKKEKKPKQEQPAPDTGTTGATGATGTTGATGATGQGGGAALP